MLHFASAWITFKAVGLFRSALSRIRSIERDQLIVKKVEDMYNAASIVNQVITRNPDLWETWKCREPDF